MPYLLQWLRRLAKWFAALVALLVTASGLLAYWPLLTVAVGPPLDPADPFSCPVLITNDSPLPIFPIRALCVYSGTDLRGNTF
jgi:hypothetical protein